MTDQVVVPSVQMGIPLGITVVKFGPGLLGSAWSAPVVVFGVEAFNNTGSIDMRMFSLPFSARVKLGSLNMNSTVERKYVSVNTTTETYQLSSSTPQCVALAVLNTNQAFTDTGCITIVDGGNVYCECGRLTAHTVDVVRTGMASLKNTTSRFCF